MANKLYYPTSANAIQKTLDAQLDQGTTGSMTLNNVTSIQNKPGVALINRIDSNGEEQPAADREWVAFEGTSGSTLTTLTRGLAGSSDQDHAVGSIVEFIYDVTQHQEVIDVLAQIVDETDTTQIEITSPRILTSINDTNGNEWIKQTATGSAVNELTIANEATGNNPIVEATGDDTNIGIELKTKGTGDIDLTGNANPNVLVGGSDPKRTIVLPAPAWKETTTGGCASVTTVEAGTNDIDYQVLDFDASTEEKAFINFTMPDSWDGGTITAKFVWTAASGSGDVIWGLQGRALANDDAIDQALGTAQTVTDTLITAADVHITSATSAITLAGSPAGGQMVHLRAYRDADAGGDTLGSDARLLAVHLEFSQATYGD